MQNGILNMYWDIAFTSCNFTAEPPILQIIIIIIIIICENSTVTMDKVRQLKFRLILHKCIKKPMPKGFYYRSKILIKTNANFRVIGVSER